MSEARLRIAVLFGGVSSEHEVSLMSAGSVLENLDPQRYDVVRVGITTDGRWRLFEGDHALLLGDHWIASSVPAMLSPDRSVHGLTVFRDGGVEMRAIDVVFPVLHGKNGEDGTIQGLCALAGIPCVGCGVFASAACMDKEYTHTVLSAHGIAGARWVALKRQQTGNPETLAQLLREADITFPVFVKPANAGSSVGISKAHTMGELSAALLIAFRHDEKVLVEQMLSGREVECAVMGNETPFAAELVGEIEPLRELYDYAGKYCDATTKLHIPARISAEATLRVRQTAVQAYRAMGCRGFARVDFFVGEEGEVVLNEINTIPGFTKISMFSKLFCGGGMTYMALLDRLVEYALSHEEVNGWTTGPSAYSTPVLAD